jgi:MFS family permease
MTRTGTGGGAAVATAGAVVLPLALAQFIASYAASNMNVAISTIADDLNTDVTGIQTTITLFTLTMAALMVPGSKLTDIWGRKFCFILGLVVYGTGALLAALAQGLGLLIVGYSLLEGVGSALLIPPIYILITVFFHDLKDRAKWFGVVSGAAGLGSAAGPLIGGLITSYVSWRASFLLQVAVVVVIALLARRIEDPPLPAERPSFDVPGAILSAAGLFFVVFGILQTSTYGWGAARVWLFVALGVVVLAAFFGYARARERGGRTPLVSPSLFRNRTSNLGLVTQHVQWLLSHPDRTHARAGHDRDPAVLRYGPADGQSAPATGADPRRVHPHRRRHRPAAAPRPRGLGELDLLAGAVPHGLRRRRHADRVGERGAVRVAGGGPG